MLSLYFPLSNFDFRPLLNVMATDNFFLKFTLIYSKVFAYCENTLVGHHGLCPMDAINSKLKYFIQIDSLGWFIFLLEIDVLAYFSNKYTACNVKGCY